MFYQVSQSKIKSISHMKGCVSGHHALCLSDFEITHNYSLNCSHLVQLLLQFMHMFSWSICQEHFTKLRVFQQGPRDTAIRRHFPSLAQSAPGKKIKKPWEGLDIWAWFDKKCQTLSRTGIMEPFQNTSPFPSILVILVLL